MSDFSHEHSVPSGSESHVKVVIAAETFVGKNRVQRHRLIYSCLDSELQSGLHALQLHIYTEEELQAVFDKDLSRAIAQAKQLMTQNGIEDLPETAQHVLSEMCFQLGQSGVSKFKNMWKALQEDNFIGASYEMLDSRWNKQTPNRCKKLSDLMKSCA